MPDSKQDKPYEGNASALVSPAMLERWRDIVGRAVVQGADITQLVQHFAERAFENKALGLEQQGTRRRALTSLRGVVVREQERAQKAMQEVAGQKSDKLRRPYSAVKIQFTPPDTTLAQQAGQKTRRTGEPPLSNISDKHAYTVTPITPAYTNASELRPYIAELDAQRLSIERESLQLDELLNRGMVGHQRTVADLAAASRELYRVARDIEVAHHEKLAAQKPVVALEDEPTAAMPHVPRPMDDDATQTYVADPKAPQRATQRLLTPLSEKPKGR